MPPPETPGQDPALAQRFAQIRQQFVRGLPARLAEIQHSTGATQHLLLHRLAGAAGAYGFAELGELARQGMRATSPDFSPSRLDAGPERANTAPGPSAWQDLDREPLPRPWLAALALAVQAVVAAEPLAAP